VATGRGLDCGGAVGRTADGAVTRGFECPPRPFPFLLPRSMAARPLKKKKKADKKKKKKKIQVNFQVSQLSTQTSPSRESVFKKAKAGISALHANTSNCFGKDKSPIDCPTHFANLNIAG
jgi:hypothetical protein